MAPSQLNRLPNGGRIDRDKPLWFEFNGKRCQGYEGDSIASALLANGFSVVSRSFKFHRPRGVMSAGVEETNALLSVADAGSNVPIVCTTIRALSDGQVIHSQNCFPSLNYDFGRVLDFTHRLWPAGFYNKTFKWPSWRWYESVIRHAAGLGNLPDGEDNNKYFHHNLHCEVLIVGAGPAGLAAALSAAKSDARVVLVELDRELGGSLLRNSAQVDGVESDVWISRTRSELDDSSNVTVMTSSTVSGYYDHNVLTITDRATDGVKRFWKVRAREVVLATGAIEQPLVFSNNDRPGIMLASAVMEYVNRYAVKLCDAMVVATNNDRAYEVAFTLHDSNLRIQAIVDSRSSVAESIAEQANVRGIPIIVGSVITDTVGSKGVAKVRVGALSADGKSVVSTIGEIACDGVAVSGGFNPTVHLYSQAGGKLRYDSELACFVPKECRQRVAVAGAANGQFSLSNALLAGAVAGAKAARRAGFDCSPVKVTTTASSSYNLQTDRITPVGDTGRQWVDLLHDITVSDIELAARENFVSVEHLKRYTTTGMSVDQGKTSNLNVLTLLAELTKRPVEEVGTTTFRPQFMPVPIGAIAGQRHGDFYAPARLLPAHAWHESQGAVFENYGGWKRPEYYAVNGRERETAIYEEALALRRSIGLFDGSPLGKIELKGPDAGEFLNRIYVNNVLTLKPGRIRYGLMLNENGVVIDDGVFARLGDDHYLVSTTAANADRITGWLEEWHQCEWPDLDVIISPMTSEWAVATIAGPNTRELLQSIESDIDFSAENLPHMALATGQVLGVSARVQRVSFSGELSFEIGVPASHSQDIIEGLFRSADNRIELVGIEALLVLRTEKGYLHVGADTDGTTNALDVGFGAIVNKKQADFVGKRSLLRGEDQRKDRRQFVGVEPLNENEKLEAGGHFVTSRRGGRRSQGMVTSGCFSPTLRRSIGLGLLERGFERIGETVSVFDEGRVFDVRITDPVFYDPNGEKMSA